MAKYIALEEKLNKYKDSMKNLVNDGTAITFFLNKVFGLSLNFLISNKPMYTNYLIYVHFKLPQLEIRRHLFSNL